MKRFARFLFACAFATSAAHAVELEGVRAPANTACPTPEEAQKQMSVPDGYEVRCFAHEPLVVNPVAMAWDARGRLWVVEAFEYPEGTPMPEEKRPFGGEAKDDKYHPVPANCLATENGKPRTENVPKDRVVILEDTDNDGVADKRTVFVEGLNLASAIICGDDGVYVGQQPHLIHFRDNNHDDKPDEWRVVLTGFGREDTHELVNSFCWGPDGWLYMTHGVFTNSKVRRPGQPESEGFKFDAGIGRCRPAVGRVSNPSPDAAGGTPALPWEFEVFADGTSNPWGTDYDERGNFFVSACVIDHFFHMAPGGIYVRQGGAPENPYSYELLPSIVKHKHFRAAYAGVQIYQGGVYPKDTWGHAFIGNIHDNAIHEEILTPVGSTFKCDTRRDFLRANNGWFRPVSTRTGPDGNLWVMDWCDKYPCYQNAKANPEGVDRDRGRIWRVVYTGEKPALEASTQKVAQELAAISEAVKATEKPNSDLVNSGPYREPTEADKRKAAAEKDAQGAVEKLRLDVERNTDKAKKLLAMVKAQKADGSKAPAPDHSRPETSMDLSKLDTPALVKLLEHPNNWMRRWSRRELAEKLAPKVVQKTENNPSKDSGEPNPFGGPKIEHHSLVTLNEAERKRAAAALEPLLKTAAATDALWTLYQADLLTTKKWTEAARSDSLNLRTAAAGLAGEDPGLAEVTEGEGKGVSVTFPMLDVLAGDKDASIRRSMALAARTLAYNRLTKDVPEQAYSELIGAQFTWPTFNDLLGKIVKASASPEDAALPFAIWMAIEPQLAHNAWGEAESTLNWLADLGPKAEPLSHTLAYKAMRRLCDTRKVENLDFALDFLNKIKDHDVLLAHALDGLEKGQDGGVIKPTKDFSALFATFAESKNAEVRKHAQSLATLWGDEKAVKRIVVEMLNAKAPEAQRLAAAKTLRKVRGDVVRDAFMKVLSDTTAQPAVLVTEVIRATSDLGGDTFIAPLTTLAASKDGGLRLTALGALTSRTEWAHAMLDAVKANKIHAGDFPVSIRRQLATNANKNIRDHAFRVLGAWQESDDNLKAQIAAKKKACLEGEPDLAAGKLVFQGTCMVCHTFYGGGQKVGPELIGSGRSNLDAILANVIDPNQIIGNGYEGFTLTTKDNQTLMGRVIEDTPAHVKLLAIGGAEQTIERSQIAKLENTHRSLMPVGFGGLPDDQFRNLIWYILAPPDEGPLTAEKKKLLGASIDAAAPKKGTGNYAIDWEAVSLWNPKWKVTAPEFDRTPIKLAEYYGRQNVLLMHPFEDKKTPASLEHQFKVDAAHHTLKFAVAADDRGDWELVVKVNGEEVKKMPVDHEKPRWKEVSIDLSSHTDKDVTARLEAHATGWSWEFGYWSDVRVE